MQKLFLFLLFPLFFSCNQSSSGHFEEQPLLFHSPKNELNEGDVRLSVTSIVVSDSTTTYVAQSSYQGHDVGLIVSVPKQKKSANSGFDEGLVLKRNGQASDQLLVALGTLYKQPADSTLMFTDSLLVTYADLSLLGKALTGGKPGLESEDAQQYKLFFESKDGKDYAELYLNVNEKEHWVELKEKDPEYRPVVVKFLNKKK